MQDIQISTKIGSSTANIVIGEGVNAKIGESLGQVLDLLPKKIAIVIGTGIPNSIRDSIKSSLGPDMLSKTFYLKEGEKAKSITAVEKLCEGFSLYGLNRSDAVLAVGGGLITDLAGFAAAIYHRGLPAIYAPTTLLAQVDAAIGGKTGVNLKTGKNLAGAFHQPLAVFCDTSVLKDLPHRETRSGLGEVAKYHFIAESLKGLKSYFEMLGLGNLDPMQMQAMPLEEQIACCIGIKLFVVSQDEKDTGLRSLLNYGHTLGHSLEVVGKFSLRHGEAVAIGLVFAAELAHILGRISEDRVMYHREIVESYGLPTGLGKQGKGLNTEKLLSIMGRDKKARERDMENFIFVLEGPEGMSPSVEVPKHAVLKALEKIG